RPTENYAPRRGEMIESADALVARLSITVMDMKLPPTPRTADLLRTPGFCPPPIFPPPMAPAFPVHHRAGDKRPARSHDGASQPLLHIGPQRRVDRKLRRFWSACAFALIGERIARRAIVLLSRDTPSRHF